MRWRLYCTVTGFIDGWRRLPGLSPEERAKPRIVRAMHWAIDEWYCTRPTERK